MLRTHNNKRFSRRLWHVRSEVILASVLTLLAVVFTVKTVNDLSTTQSTVANPKETVKLPDTNIDATRSINQSRD